MADDIYQNNLQTQTVVQQNIPLVQPVNEYSNRLFEPPAVLEIGDNNILT
jgi:hypothetical protein